MLAFTLAFIHHPKNQTTNCMKRFLSFQALYPILFSFGLVLFSSLSSFEQGSCTTAATLTVPTIYFNSENIINAATTIDNESIFSITVTVFT